MKNKKSVGLAAVLLAAIFTNGTEFLLTAANTNFFTHPVSPYSFVQALPATNRPAALALVNRILAMPSAASSVPAFSPAASGFNGAFWSLQNSNLPPVPGDFFPDLPVYTLDASNRLFLIDDRSVDYQALGRQLAAENLNVPAPANDLVIDTNTLWLEVPANALPGSNFFNVVIHNTTQDEGYDLLTKTDLTLPLWTVETNVIGAAGDSTPVTLAQNERTNLFVWARSAVIPIYAQPMTQEVLMNDMVTFSVVAGGEGLTYQWTFNGTPIYGATGSSYTINRVIFSQQGVYAVIITSAAGSVTSQTAMLTVDMGSEDPNFMRTFGPRQDYVFRSGVNYYISSPVLLYGKTTIEGGAIVKFDYTQWYPTLQVFGTLVCKGTLYNPSILTTVDDDAFGEAWSYGPPQPEVTGVPYLDLSAADSQSITNLRFRYADEAVSTPAGGRLDVWDSQFFQCDAAVVNWFGGVDSLHNVLIAGCYDAVAAFTNNFTIAAEQVTAEVSNFWDAGVSPSHFSLTNSIVLGNVVSATSQNTSINPDPANFEINGAGNYYLAAGSTLHQTGSTNVSPYLLNEFHNKTTYAPIAMPAMMSLSGNLTFAPQTPRYTNGPPDKGYYYDALDYTVARLINFGSITVEPGTVIGFREDTNADSFWGFDLRENSSFAGHGTPNQPIVLADVQMVQEQLEYPCYADFVPDFEGMPDVPGPVMDFRFCNFYPAVGWYHVWAGLDYLWDFMPSFNSVVNWTLRDCNLHGGQINLGEPDCGGLPGYSGFYGIPYNTIYGSGAVTWNNNLFDNVQINLQPTYDWFDGTINVDLAFQAENNLFRHGDIFTLVPVPASAGNWTFKDNLFDKVEFSQGTAMPLDFDYNGYWALTASEVQWNVDASQLLATTTGDGTTDGLNEVLLDYAPPYASGPFGDYYLTTLTPLYQAGSRSAGDAGLGQYTTFTNQVKDATNQPVNIGLHYVAAPSSYLLTSNSCPLDSDGDGISDYVEVEHGTDPNNPMTDGVTPDAYNAVYDDVDLDGDGLTGLMERFLGTDPLTADNPLKLPPVQSVSGFIDLPLASLPTVISNAALRVYLNGQESANCNLYQATDGGWHLQLDSLTVPNGGSMLQLGLSYGEDMDQLQTVFGSTCLLQVTNAITVDPLTMMFTDALHIEAGVNVAADNYEIDIYDISNNLLKTLTGTVQTNWISAGWDLTDTNGDVIVTGPLRCDFYLTSAAAAAATANAARSQAANAASGSAASVHYRLTKHIGGKSFAVAFAGFKFPNAQDVVSENVVDVLCAGEGLSSLDYNLLPNQAVNTPHADNAFEWYGGTNGNKSTLTDALLNGSCGNFYWMGHGNTTVISPTTNLVSTERITTTELQPALGNQGYIGTNTFANNHPYRLVILDGCNTYSWPWAKTWGIPWFGEDVKDHYISEGLDVCAFVGWTKTTYTSYSNNGGEAYGRCQRELFANWYAGFTLKQCLNFYNQALTNELNKPYLPATNNFNSWKIAGCSDLRTSDR